MFPASDWFMSFFSKILVHVVMEAWEQGSNEAKDYHLDFLHHSPPVETTISSTSTSLCHILIFSTSVCFIRRLVLNLRPWLSLCHCKRTFVKFSDLIDQKRHKIKLFTKPCTPAPHYEVNMLLSKNIPAKAAFWPSCLAAGGAIGAFSALTPGLGGWGGAAALCMPWDSHRINGVSAPVWYLWYIQERIS